MKSITNKDGMPDNKLTLGNKLTIISIIVAIVIGSFVIYSIAKEWFPESEKPIDISIKGEIDELVIFNDIVNLGELEFYTTYPDSLLSCKSSYKYGDKLTVNLKFELSENQERYISAFLIDPNNLVRMTFPSIDSNQINKILTDKLNIDDIIVNDSNTYKDIEKVLQLNFDVKEDGKITSRGIWRYVVILWKEQTDKTIIPTMMITETIDFEKDKSPEEDYLSNIYSILSLIITIGFIIIVIVGYVILPWYYKTRSREKEKAEIREEKKPEPKMNLPKETEKEKKPNAPIKKTTTKKKPTQEKPLVKEKNKHLIDK